MNNDCIYNIFIKLNVNDIINCALVCKRFYNIGKTEMVWYLLFKENFYNVKCTNENNKKFYDNYKKYSILNNFLLKNNQDSVNIIIRVLNVSYKQLQTVPKELGQLASLQELSLSNNQLQTIPKELGQLASLQELYLHNNQLQTIPKELGQLASLRYFQLDNNLKNVIFLDNGTNIIYK
jgi:Leucine-rich repeat (LRR) protein